MDRSTIKNNEEGAPDGAPFIFWDFFGAQDKHSGVGRVADRLLTEMKNDANGRILSPRLLGAFSSLFVKLRLPWFAFISLFVIFRTRRKKTILHGLCNYNYYPFLPRNIKLVLTVHDVIPLEDEVSGSSRFWFRFLFLKALDRADAIVAVSQSTAKKIERHTGNALSISEKLSVIDNGFENLSVIASSERACKGFSSVLFVSRFESYKGFHLLVDLISRSLGTDIRYNVVTCERGKEFLFNSLSAAALESVEIFVSVGQGFLASLYQKASLYLSLSSSEGYGLPFDEACSFLLPVLYVSCDPIDERADDRFHMMIEDAQDLDSIYEQLISALAFKPNKESYLHFVAMKPSWKDAAKKYQNLYNSL